MCAVRMRPTGECWTVDCNYRVHRCSLSRQVCVHIIFCFCRMSIYFIFWADRFYLVCLTLFICWDVHPTQQNDNVHPLWKPNFSMHIIVLLSAMSNLRFQPKKRHPPDPFFIFLFFLACKTLEDGLGHLQITVPQIRIYTPVGSVTLRFSQHICPVSIIISIFPLLKYLEVRVSLMYLLDLGTTSFQMYVRIR